MDNPWIIYGYVWYTLWQTFTKRTGKSPCLMGTSTMSTGPFSIANSLSLPEGNSYNNPTVACIDPPKNNQLPNCIDFYASGFGGCFL